MKFKIYTFGKIKDSNIKEIVDYYQSLSSRYFSIEFIQIKDISDRKISKEDIEKYLNNFNVLLSEDGREFTTLELVEKIERWKINSVDVDFFIANAFGFDQELKNQANLLLSLSKMTFPHEMAQVLLLEQLFRIGDIIKGGKYHK